MEISKFDKEVAPVYNKLITEATDTYLHAPPDGLDIRGGELGQWKQDNPTAPQTARMDHDQFVHYALKSNRQPMNPVTLAREALGFEASATELDIMAGLQKAYADLITQYEEHRVDPRGLVTIFEIMHLTEAYIAGYSREVDQVSQKLKAAAPEDKEFIGAERWNNVLWVPDEGMHDRSLQYLANTVPGFYNLENFYTDHARHMKVGNHIDLLDFIMANAYVSLQEDATVVNYENATRIYGPVFGHIIWRLGQDEARHKKAYRYVQRGFGQQFPDQTLIATRDTMNDFGMPGEKGIHNFERRSGKIGLAGVLDPQGLLRSQKQLIGYISAGTLTPKTYKGKQAQEELVEGTYQGAIDLQESAKVVNNGRERAIRIAQKNGRPLPLIIGVTVDANRNTKKLHFPMSKAA